MRKWRLTWVGYERDVECILTVRVMGQQGDAFGSEKLAFRMAEPNCIQICESGVEQKNEKMEVYMGGL